MPTLHYQDQGFFGLKYNTAQAAFNLANRAIEQARLATPVEAQDLYKSVVRWESDGYAWYWILR